MKEEPDMAIEFDKYEDKLDEELRKYFTSEMKVSHFQLSASRILHEAELNIRDNCKYLIDDYRKYVFIDENDNYKAKPKEGYDIEAERAYRKLEKCTEFLYELHSDLNENVEFAERFYYGQFDICRMNCFDKLKPRYIPKIKVCLRKCRFYTFNYIDRAIEDSLHKWVSDKAYKVDTRNKEDKFEHLWYPK
jgi:hypothetical protein